MIQALIAAGLLFGVLGLLAAFSRSDVVSPYAQALRIIAKNSMLWVMFLACMSTSVFFSFDSRFNVVFPQEERKRVAELRATTRSRPLLPTSAAPSPSADADVRELFKSEGWHAYEGSSTSSPRRRRAATGEIEQYFIQQMEGATAASRSSRSASPRRRAARPASPARRCR